MKPERASKRLHSITHAQARMFEFNVPAEHQYLEIGGGQPADLFPLVIGILGDEAAHVAKLNIDEPTLQLRLLPQDSFGLHFAATFLHAYVVSKQGEGFASELLLLSAGAYYLSDLAGSAGVLTRQAADRGTDDDGWTRLLRWSLEADWVSDGPTFTAGVNALAQTSLVAEMRRYFQNGEGRPLLLTVCSALRNEVYHTGTPRDLLFVDVVVGLIKKRLRNAARRALPFYSTLPEERWAETLAKPDFMKELWPSQHIFGERGLLQGRSAVVQMPTSAGKTRAIELVIRSAFYSGRAKLAVVIAPFRALCSEISSFLRSAFHGQEVVINELTDALQTDYSSLFEDLLQEGFLTFDFNLSATRQIVVVTPEKLLYVLRHNPELIQAIGIVFYDEGHQFDSGSRGVTYELLLTSIKRLVPQTTQTVLISAVIQNATAISEWLIGEEAVVVDGQNLSTTDRSVAFASWTKPLGQLHFVDPENPDHFDYFVPRIIDPRELQKKPRERKQQVFPNKDARSVALYLGLQAVENGSVAIFCGKKSTASTMTKLVVNAYDRGLPMAAPSTYSDATEVLRLTALYKDHFGAEADATKASALGIFSHHGNTPHGIRLAVEYGMKEGLIKFVLCTSTLAQGVNLPIRYLIISGTMQGVEQIKARDFHNLVGRAGRAGMHTEGTILFSDPSLYDNRAQFREKWKWDAATKLLDAGSTEATSSSLLDLLSPLRNDTKTLVMPSDVVALLLSALNDPAALQASLLAYAAAYERDKFSEAGLLSQLREKTRLLETLESYLLSNRGEESFESFLLDTAVLASETLASFFGDEQQKLQLAALFRGIATRIENEESDTVVQALYGRTLLGFSVAIRVRQWTLGNVDALLEPTLTEEDMLTLIWPLLIEVMPRLFSRLLPDAALQALAQDWINNTGFITLYEHWCTAGGLKRHGQGTRQATMDDVVEICENALSFDSTLIVAAISENLSTIERDDVEMSLRKLSILQKRLKYGVANSTSIAAYEMGFADRVIAGKLGAILSTSTQDSMRLRLRELSNEAINLLEQYPAYFTSCLRSLVRG
jgi:POLQ-like helicase